VLKFCCNAPRPPIRQIRNFSATSLYLLNAYSRTEVQRRECSIVAAALCNLHITVHITHARVYIHYYNNTMLYDRVYTLIYIYIYIYDYNNITALLFARAGESAADDKFAIAAAQIQYRRANFLRLRFAIYR